jgi:hypothetical protein
VNQLRLLLTKNLIFKEVPMSLFAPNIEKLKRKGNVKKLIILLKDRERCIRDEAANALESLGWTTDDKSTLFYYLIAKKEWDTIDKWKNFPVDPLIQTLDFVNDDSKDRDKLKEIMVRAGKSIISHLVKELKNKSETVKRRVIEVLGEIHDPEGVSPLLNCLNYHRGDCIIGSEVIAALGKIGDKRAIESLVPYLTHPDALVRKTSADALGKLRWKPTNSTVKACYMVAKRKWKDVGKLGEDGVKALLPILEDKHKSEILQASKTLMAMDDCDISLRIRAAKIHFSYMPQKKCLICGITLDTRKKLLGIVSGDDLLKMVDGKGPLVEKTAYKCRQCGISICYKCAQTSKCKICNNSVFDIAIS